MIKDKKSHCRPAVFSDIPAVARIHMDAFEGFFLSKLGYSFLKVMYKAFLYDSAGLFLVHQSKDGMVTGFAVGSMNAGKKDRFLVMRFFPQFLIAAIPAFFRYPKMILARFGKIFFERGIPLDLPKEVSILRSIGVSTFERGNGVAPALLDTLEQMALRKGAVYVYLTTDQNNNARAQNFYRRQGYVVVKCFQQDGCRVMLLMRKLLREVEIE